MIVRAACVVVSLALLVMVATFSGSAAPGDVVFEREGGAEGGTPPAMFPHWIHRIRYKCYACHPEPFKMKAGENEITMEAIQGGKSCGVCHNDKIAWGVSFETCSRCHVERK